MKCPNCGEWNAKQNTKCVKCGSDLTQPNDYTLTPVAYFKINCASWFGEVKEFDCMTYLQHQKHNNVYLPNYRANFGIGLDEEILFTRDTSFWSNNNQGLVMTNLGIYVITDNDDPESRFAFSWASVNNVVYKEYCFYFCNADGENIAWIQSNYFFKEIDAGWLNKIVGPSLATHMTKMAQLAGEEKDIYDEVVELENQEQYDSALEKLNQLMTNAEVNNDALSHFWKGRILVKKSLASNDIDDMRFQTANNEFKKVRELTDDKDLIGYSYYWTAENYNLFGQFYNARNLFLLSMESSSEDIREHSKQEFEEMEQHLSNVFDNYTTQYEYKDRKFLMPVNDYEIAGCLVEGIDTFRMSNIPSCIKFPMGHPIAGELYIGHPYNSSLYVPYEKSEDTFFVDKVHELCYLLECLGAEEITITSIKGKSVNELGNYENNISGGADIKLWSVNAERNKSGSSERTNTSNIQRTLSQKFDPMRPPFVPEDLIWYSEQPQWQRLVNSRLNGNLLEYNEFVSTADTKFVSSSERTSIKASAEYLWSKFDGNYETKSNEQFKESTETQWKVEVKFRSIKQFSDTTASSSKQLSGIEQQYLENIKEFLEDDAEITTRERKMLDRIRQSLGISEERAKELEASLTPQLTEDEQEYLDMYREYAEKGEITEKERNRLKKFAAALGISEERAKELEG